MAVRVNATQSALFLQNGRTEANPPVVFPGFGPGKSHSTMIWCKMLSNIPTQVLTHQCTNGALTYFSNDGVNWAIILRNESAISVIHYVNPVLLNRWTVFAFTMEDGNRIRMYIGGETDPALPVQLAEVLDTIFPMEGEHSLLYPVATPNNVICNFKVFDSALTQAQLQAHVNNWMHLGDESPGLPQAIWASPLRVPGDLSSIAFRTGTGNWNHNCAYDFIQFPENFVFEKNEPGVLSRSKCAAWLYPRFTGTITIQHPHNAVVTANPGMTPAIDTFYDGAPFHYLDDRGAVPAEPYLAHVYQAIPSGAGPGVVQTETWALYLDENGNRISNTTDPIYSLDFNGAQIPGIVNIQTVYAWRFGAQFKFPGRVPAEPTGTAVAARQVLYVVYAGIPTGIPQLPPVEMAGLFILDKNGPSTDRYNQGITFKIPDPTVRTAFIGE